jgi:NAD-dependent SIR2 family protein deacetylase
MAKLTSESLNAAPTKFHQWLGKLQTEGKLLRVYTQNIDGLEMKAGLTAYPNLQSDLAPNPSVHCVSLHGSLLHLRCQSCNSTFLTEMYIHVLHQGALPHCETCRRASENRVLEGKRTLPLRSIRPDIVLYGDDFHPTADQITAIANQDMRTIDLLLVVGTSLRIPGTRDIVRNFSAQLRRKGNGGGSTIRSIFINMEKVGDAGRAQKYFDVWVEGDCQQFVSMVGNMKEDVPAGADCSLGAVKEYALARRDSRTLWRYY